MRRRLIFWILITGFIWLVVTRYTEIQKLVLTLKLGQWEWVFAAGLLQIVYYVVFSAAYQSAFDTVEVKSRLFHLIPVTLGALFVNVIAPIGGASGAALFADDARRNGQSPTRAAAGVLLQLIAEFGAFTIILIGGLVYLFTENDLQIYEILAALLLFAIIFGLSGVMVLGLWRPDLLNRLLVWVQSRSNGIARRFKQGNILPEDWAETNAAEFSSAASAISQHPVRLARTLGIAMSAHLIDILCLYMLFRAFHQQITFWPLIAGYAIGILFWIVSITPQGIGIVEGVMALVYTSLGVPAEVATTVSLAFRGLSFWLPLGLGFLLIRRVKTFDTGDRAPEENLSVRIAALLTAVMGLINVLSAVTPGLSTRLALIERLSPLEVRHSSHLIAALAGFALILLSVNLWRRKRTAWLLTIIVLVISTIAHLLKGLDYEEALLSAGMAVWLWFLRPHFHAHSDRPSVDQGLRVLAGAFIFTLLYGVAGFYLLDRHFSINFGFWAAVRQTVMMFTQFSDPQLQPVTSFGRYFADSIYAVSLVTLVYALLMILRPVVLRQPATPAQRSLAEKIVTTYGRSSLARLALLDDKAYFLSPGGSLVAYTIKGRTAAALGDPIGPVGDLPAAIDGFKTMCEDNDWTPVFYQTLPDNLEEYHREGFKTLCIGHEAIVELETFTLEGKAGKDYRVPYHHLSKLGYQAVIYPPPISAEILNDLRAISNEWLTMVHGTEKRFSLGWFEDDYIRSGPVAAVISPENERIAFANIMPEYQRNEASIDLMRRRRKSPPGTMDFLFVFLLLWAEENGFETFNLGLSALSGVGEKPQDPAIEQLLHYIYEHVNQFYNFKGLHAFKEKFHPSWSPRYLVYPGTANLASAWMAIMQANSGTSDLVWSLLKPKTNPAPSSQNNLSPGKVSSE